MKNESRDFAEWRMDKTVDMSNTGGLIVMKQKSDPLPQTINWNSLGGILYLWIPACAIGFLMGAVPYASGYGFKPVTLLHMMQTLWEMPDWEHGFLVPMAIAFIVYELRDDLAKLVPQPTGWGVPILLLGLFFYWIGQRVDNHYIGYAAIQVLVAAWIVMMLGWRYMIALAFPWMFMVFLWPLLFLETYLAFPLRLIMSNASVDALNLFGVSAVKVGTSILSAADPLADLPVGARFSVDVADPCSGIRSLFALMMVSALYGFLSFRSWWKHALVFLSSIPLAILGNLVRIVLLTVGTLLFGARFALGDGLENPSTYHMFAGFFVFAVALGGMFLVAKVLDFGWLGWMGSLQNREKVLVEGEGKKDEKTAEKEDLY